MGPSCFRQVIPGGPFAAAGFRHKKQIASLKTVGERAAATGLNDQSCSKHSECVGDFRRHRRAINRGVSDAQALVLPDEYVLENAVGRSHVGYVVKVSAVCGVLALEVPRSAQDQRL